ncbi:hypothetical protein TSUD_328480 [Trifolium subterraneum]|uniref:RNase H type-1 domain-containing protein n=1 Tax=Trifolium subterraneum TaxID=3900 RepID=A0A2Z6LWN6_TRISU|nr:hypothetical protein TSUD_328480 [Trifolium subterraneum]
MKVILYVFEVYKDTITIRLSLGNARWFFTGIYASPVYTSRLELWHHINDLRRDITEPWLLMGDFNEIIRPSEQKGGNFSHTRAVPLLNVMNNCNLVDVNSTGGKCYANSTLIITLCSYVAVYPEKIMAISLLDSKQPGLSTLSTLILYIWPGGRKQGISSVASNSPTLNEEACRSLTKQITKEEVTQALNQMHPFKAPGPDGFQCIFFTQYWHIIGDDVVRLISTAFETGGFPPSLSETLIALIPKTDCPNNLKEFQPISLCNTVYKLITKIMVNRLRPFLTQIIGPYQGNFLPGRGTTDNDIILQEAIHTMRKSKRKKGDMVFKIDLEKAYDNVSWEFLHLCLIKNGFPPMSIKLIMFCVISSSLSIMWNGRRLPSFTPTRGLRQGGPLSPYLFVLWLKVNINKSKVFFSSTTRSGKISSIVASIGINRTLSLEKYLGFPMMHGRLRRRYFEFFEEKISKRLAIWQHNLLNKAGRMTLIKSVLNFIPNYYMQIAWLPQTTCDVIDRTTRNFIWKGSSDIGIHLVGWDKITKSKKLGGVGIRKARDANTSLLGKLVWNIHQNSDALWVKVIQHKYLKEENLLNLTNNKTGSVTWNAIRKALSALKEGFHFRLGNGNSSFWYSNWSGNGVIANQVMFVDIHDLEMRVRDVYTDGNWQFNLLYTNLPQEIKEKLNSTAINLNPFVNDCYTWKASWSWLWHVPAPEKIKFFIWTMLHNSLPTRETARNALCLDNEMYSDYENGEMECSWGNCMILNVDGSSIGNPGISGYGGLIRNADGAWIHGFFGNLGVTNILHAELMAIYKGLLLA